jgi:protease I
MNRRVVILTAEGFQDEEYLYCYYRLTEEGITPHIYTPTGKSVIGKYGVPTKGFHISTVDLSIHNYNAVLIPGGFEAPGRLRHLVEVTNFVKSMDEFNKPIGAICHGPQVLISANVVRCRRVTSYKDVHVDLMNAGAFAEYMAPVIIDRNIVTSSHYDFNGPFMKAFIELLNK